jgi:Dolichyl-phosphate-mannose-protein mannosyltransferase
MQDTGFRVQDTGSKPLDVHPASQIARAALIAGVALALFLALSLKNITLPGLYYDEALDVVPAMQVLLGQPVEPVRGAAITIAGRTFPLMIMDYVGTVNTYLAIPLFAVAGVNVTSVRLLPILLAALSLILGYRLAARLFDWRVAAAATLLAAVDPSYVFFSRMGNHVTSVMNVFALGSLLAFLRWRESKRARWLLLGGLLLGLGLWAKVLFLWWIVALAVAWVVWSATNHVVASAGQHARPTGMVFAGLLVGSAPLWLYNLATGGTLISLGRNALVTEQGVNNLDVLANLQAAVESFVVLLDGRYFWFLGGQFANRANVIGFAAAAIVCLLLIRRRPEWRAGLVLIGVLIVSIVAQSAFTVSGIWATHLYILFPLPQMVMALGVVLAAETAAGKRRWLRGALIGLLLAGGMLASWQVDMTYHAALERSRGLSRFSDAIYRLADWLDARAYGTVYAVDWGMAKNVQILTQGRVNPIEIFSFAGEPPEAFVQRAEKALLTPNAVYLLHSKEDTVYELYPTFQATADRLGVKLKIIEATRDQSGAPVHVMWIRE